MTTQHGVYLCFDAAGELIYAGRTSQVAVRMRAHASSSPWWPAVVRTEWIDCNGPSDARLTERTYIESRAPMFNVNDTVPVRQGRVQLPDEAKVQLRALYDVAAGAHGWDSPENDRLNAHILALRNAGWALAAIGGPLGLTREAIRLRQNQAPTDLDAGLPVPPLPVKVRPLTARERSRALLTPAVESELRELYATARRVTGGTRVDSPMRTASTELTERLATLAQDGATLTHLDEAIGAAHGTVNMRLRRHGYLPCWPSQAPYLGRQTAHPRLRLAATA